MNNTNLVEMMAQARNFQSHRKKLADIMGASSIRTSAGTFDNRRIKVINTFYNNHDRASRYNIKIKQEAVQKENDLILKKIIGVNNRRMNTLNNKILVGSHNSMASLKKSMQNINLQNQKIAHKLVSTTSELRQQKQFQSFKKHLERKERIKKYEFDQQIGMIVPKKIKSLHKLRSIEDGTLRKSAFKYNDYQNQQK